MRYFQAEVLTNTTNKIYLLKDSDTVLVLDYEREEDQPTSLSNDYTRDPNKVCVSTFYMFSFFCIHNMRPNNGNS